MKTTANSETPHDHRLSIRRRNGNLQKGLLALIAVLGLISLINAQSAGSRGGVNNSGYSAHHPINQLVVEQNVEDVITIESTIEIRVQPDQIRIVLAITENAKTSSECEQLVFAKIANLKSDLVKLGIEPGNIVDDFIAILPRYTYSIEQVAGQKVAVETLDDYSMQSNLHIKVDSDSLAMQAIRAAFKQNVTDVIAFDYWNKELSEKKQQALKTALRSAQEKSHLILDSTFDQLPQPINVKTQTNVIMPDALYETFDNSHSQNLTQNYRGNLTVISAARPKNTYYRGLDDPTADLQPKSVAMNCEISIVSTVQLFYASPTNSRLYAIDTTARHSNSKPSPQPESLQ